MTQPDMIVQGKMQQLDVGDGEGFGALPPLSAKERRGGVGGQKRGCPASSTPFPL